MHRAALLTLTLPFLAAQSAPPAEVVATVNGTPIYASELPIQAKIASLRRQEYDTKVQAARELAAKKIVEKAAQAKGQTMDQFLAAEVDNKVPEPSEDELRGFYLAKQNDFGASFDAAREQVRQNYRNLKLQQMRQALGQKLFQNADIRIVISPPRNEIDFGAGPQRGAAKAPVTIVEFSDFQCPYCKGALPVLKQVTEKYGDRVQFLFKDFPLNDIHPQAQAAAEAAHCAEEQGKFWEYHDALFGIAPNFDEGRFLSIAIGVGVKNPEGFRACIESHKYKARVEQDSTLGQALGVDGTPMFYINGIALSGAAPMGDFEKIIDGELQSAK
jgi:predicted DsbA family dithiol-disulfide isomerase